MRVAKVMKRSFFLQTLQKKKLKVNANVKDRIENLFMAPTFVFWHFGVYVFRHLNILFIRAFMYVGV